MCCSVLHLKHPNVVYFSTPFTGQNHLFGRLTFFFNRKKQEEKQKSRQKRRVYQHFSTTPKHWQTRKSWWTSRKIMIILCKVKACKSLIFTDVPLKVENNNEVSTKLCQYIYKHLPPTFLSVLSVLCLNRLSSTSLFT